MRSDLTLRPTSPRSRFVWLAVCALWALTACVPTISKPRGETHLTLLAQAEAHQHAGRYREAAEAFKAAAEAAERRVDRDEALYRQSRVLARMDDHRGAIAICDELAAANPPARRTLRAKLDSARYRLVLGEVERAEQDLTSLVLEHPEAGPSRSALRLLLSRHVEGAGSPEEALAWVREFSARVQGWTPSEMLMNVEAELLLGLGRTDEARALLEKQVARFPYPKGHLWDDALYRLADIALDANDPNGAIRYLEQMIDVHESSATIGSYTRPLFSKAALRIARIYRDELHDNDAAIKAYRRVRSEFPRSLVVDDALEEEAEILFASGDRKGACDRLHELLREHEVGSARRRAEKRVETDCAGL